MKTREQAIAYSLTMGEVYEDYPFHDANWSVMRCRGNKKIFACIYERLDHIWINVKVNPEWRDFWREAYHSVVPAYHMNKENWNSVILDGTVPEDEIKRMIAESYELVRPKRRRDDSVMIERRHLLLSSLIRDEKAMKIIEQAAGTDEVLLRKLKTSRKTLYQIFELYDGYGMDQSKQRWAFEKLAEIDVENPLKLQDVCEYLKEKEWKIDLIDLGLYKAEVWKGQECCFRVKRVHKYCEIQEHEVKKSVLSMVTDGAEVRVEFSREADLQAFWKQILISGRAEVKEGLNMVVHCN